MNTLHAGFSRVNITPPLGIFMQGYYQDRFAEGVLDELNANALALCCGDQKLVLISCDLCETPTREADLLTEAVFKATGLKRGEVLLHVTHTHTGPAIHADPDDELLSEYFRSLSRRLADAARMALDDLKPARMGFAVGQAPNIAFVRRFRMKDGKVRTNPGVGNPDILAPIGDVDERVNVLRFDREGADSIVLANFGCHPDTVGGCRISGDWPGFFCRVLERSLPGTKALFFNGAEGDVNHVNVKGTGGDLNDMANDFDDVFRGYGHARHMGNVVAGAVMQVFDKVNYVDVDKLACLEKCIELPSNMPAPEELPLARKYNDLHKAGRDSEIPFEGMELTTVVAEAERMLDLEHGPASFPMHLFGFRIGPVALLGIPGEPFTGIGRQIKEAEGWKAVLPCCLSNGWEGYFPMMEAYQEGGYESRSSIFKAGVAEYIIAEGTKLLNELHD